VSIAQVAEPASTTELAQLAIIASALFRLTPRLRLIPERAAEQSVL